MPEPIKGTGRYMAGIDGLRALAVLAVIVYHLNYNWAPGGLLGVGIFFVLSGYLITDLLVAQWSQYGRLDMKDFWLRRARRLMPALLIMLVTVAAWIAFFVPSQISVMHGDVPAAMLYVSNWWLIFQQVSYFEKFGPPSPLGHLWSLAVEEQFYLFWPLALSLGLRFVKRRGPLVCLTLAMAAASAIAMAIMHEPGLDPSRVYYGTDTRVFALLIGSALAMIWPSRKLTSNLSRTGRTTLDVAGGTGLLILLFSIWKTSQYDDFLYQGGLVLLSVASAVVVAVLAHPASRLAKMMGCKPMRWLGVRSYGIYLWHFPVIILISPAVEQSGWFAIPRAILLVAASIGLAALSWRYIEEPIRHGALGRLWTQLRSRNEEKRTPHYSRLVASICAIVLCATYYGVASRVSDATASPAPHNPIPASNSSETSKQQEQDLVSSNGVVSPFGPVRPIGPMNPNSQAKQNDSAKQGGTAPAKGSAHAHQSVKPNGSTNASNRSKPNSPLQPENKENIQISGTIDESAASEKPDDSGTKNDETPLKSGKGITVFGDSVMLDVAPHLEKLLPGIAINAQIGRQMSQAQDVVEELKSKGKLGSRVIIELGTNGSFSKGQLLTLLHSLGNVETIILVNTRVPRPWESDVNTTLSEVASTFPNVTMVDWYSASAGKTSYFYPDGVHLNPEGSKIYASLVAHAIP